MGVHPGSTNNRDRRSQVACWAISDATFDIFCIIEIEDLEIMAKISAMSKACSILKPFDIREKMAPNGVRQPRTGTLAKCQFPLRNAYTGRDGPPDKGI